MRLLKKTMFFSMLLLFSCKSNLVVPRATIINNLSDTINLKYQFFDYFSISDGIEPRKENFYGSLMLYQPQGCRNCLVTYLDSNVVKINIPPKDSVVVYYGFRETQKWLLLSGINIIDSKGRMAKGLNLVSKYEVDSFDGYLHIHDELMNSNYELNYFSYKDYDSTLYTIEILNKDSFCVRLPIRTTCEIYYWMSNGKFPRMDIK
jgi:hypothetical protein